MSATFMAQKQTHCGSRVTTIIFCLAKFMLFYSLLVIYLCMHVFIFYLLFYSFVPLFCYVLIPVILLNCYDRCIIMCPSCISYHHWPFTIV